MPSLYLFARQTREYRAALWYSSMHYHCIAIPRWRWSAKWKAETSVRVFYSPTPSAGCASDSYWNFRVNLSYKSRALSGNCWSIIHLFLRNLNCQDGDGSPGMCLVSAEKFNYREQLVKVVAPPSSGGIPRCGIPHRGKFSELFPRL